MKTLRTLPLALTALALLCALTAAPAVAQNAIDGAWAGAYTSTYSPDATKEMLLFNTVDDTMTGVYLSESGSAGTLTHGVLHETVYIFVVTEPVEGCPEPSTGIFYATVNGDRMTYGFRGVSCQGVDVGQGTATRKACD